MLQVSLNTVYAVKLSSVSEIIFKVVMVVVVAIVVNRKYIK